jgi:dTDP-4-amino-4,6-dideoxy-D-galactose acyltransferase
MISPHQILEWDSAFFGRRIARVGVGRLSPAVLAELDGWMAANQVECAYYLCAADDEDSIVLAEQHHFHLTDIRLTLETAPDAARNGLAAGLAVEPAQAGQIEALKTIARSSHRGTRFHHDHHFSPSQSDALYATWIEQSCEGRADRVFTVLVDGTVAGYVTCHLDSPTSGHIGLLAVADAARGRGAGSALLHAALGWFQDRQTTLVTVVTQGRGVPAQRLYHRRGFAVRTVELWYHYWPGT